MRIEIKSAAQFLVDLVRLNGNTTVPLSDDQLERFKSNVSDLLLRHYTNHWFPDKPFKGSGYRCIRINGKMDPLIARAGFMMGLAVSFLRSLFPTELTMWVDPREVSYRIGENGSICILYEGLEKTIVKGEDVLPPATVPTEQQQQQSNGMKTPEKSPSPSMVVVQKSSPIVISSPVNVTAAVVTQQSPSPPPALPHHHHQQPPPQQQQQQVHHHHHQQHHHHPHHPHQQHHFSPSKSVVVSSPLQLSRPMSPVTSQLSQQQNQQQAAAAAMQLSMFLMNKDSGLIKCKESLQRGLDVARPLQMMDRLFVSS